ncbi:MAG: right-handed parallel beta-helix repeat-containing protein [Kiritimatiellia bacterium]
MRKTTKLFVLEVMLGLALVGYARGACVHAAGGRVQGVTIRVRPGESLVAVRDKVRALSAEARAKGVEVVLAPGRYRLEAPLDFDARDGGSAEAPVVWRSGDGGRAVLCDGVNLSAASFEPVADAAILARLDGAAKGRVLVADLAASGFPFWKPLTREIRQPTPVPELFVDGVRMTPAQWPNAGEWATIRGIVDAGTRDNDGSVGQGLGKARAAQPGPPRGGTFVYEGDRPARWTKAPEVWLHGFWCFDWYDAVIPVAAINAASNTITFAAKHTYGVRQGNPRPRRWRAVHLLEELDAPGEYYVDPVGKKLYFWPVRPLEAATRIVVTGVWRNLVRVEKARDLVFRGLGFEECFGDAVNLKEGERVAFERCAFRNIRGKAIYSQACTGCRVAGCDVSDTGTGGVTLNGGDRKRLVPGGNVMEDTCVRNFSVHCLTYASGVHIGGVGNVVRHCEFSGAPHMAVGVSGNDHVFEYNVVSNVCMSSDDAAAFYKGRNPSCRGNVLRYNFWSEIGSPRGHGTAAVYFDDGDCGDTVYGNVFHRCGEPGFGGFGTVFCHGGHSNRVENCVFVECRRPLGSAPWSQARWVDFLHSPLEQNRLLKEVCVTSAVWVARYPAIASIFAPEVDTNRWNLAVNNAFIDCPLVLPGRAPGETQPGLVRGRWATNATDVVFAGDPGFVDAAAKNFALRPDAEVYRRIPAFKPIPFEKIGPLTRR